MLSSNPYLKIISALVRKSPVSVSLLLGALALGSSNAHASAVPPPTREASVAERLATIRAAVSDVTSDDAKGNGESVAQDPCVQLAWGNWGGWPNWNNWRNWRNWGNWFRNW